MATQSTTAQESLQGLAGGNLDVLDTLTRMTEGSFEASGLDPKTFMLVRMAALATLDAAPVSWLANLAVAGDANVTAEDAVGMLVAIAPVIGTARVVSAASKVVRALGLAELLDDDEEGGGVD
jgi:hypothetical protein